MAITTQQIHAIADQLHEQGIKPTLAEVRKALGGGSFTTISEAMKSWRQDNQQEEQLRQVELPSGIAERLQTLGADMWQTAIDIANDRLVKEREALESIKPSRKLRLRSRTG
ncbi:DNA-binding protein, partial [Psychrobacter sp. JCM 18903]|uniref:DNA-binding protein n=1 Tax=Psychrobacter sp. JCM 18903 TaxID=1298610 RepID=UPI0005EF1244